MNKILGIVLLISSMVFAARPPSQDVIDQYVEIAQKADVKKLQGKKSKFQCRFALMHDDPSFFANAKTMDEAVQRLQLICIKSQCQRVGEMMDEGAARLNAMSEKEFRDFLEFSGATPEEIELAIQNRGLEASQKDLTCESGTPSMRMLAFDSCFAVPVECSKTGRL